LVQEESKDREAARLVGTLEVRIALEVVAPGMIQDQVEVDRMDGVDVEEDSMVVGIVTGEVDRMVIVAAEHYRAEGTGGMAEH